MEAREGPSHPSIPAGPPRAPNFIDPWGLQEGAGDLLEFNGPPGLSHDPVNDLGTVQYGTGPSLGFRSSSADERVERLIDEFRRVAKEGGTVQLGATTITVGPEGTTLTVGPAGSDHGELRASL
jgi:hypothetical protein